MKLGTVTLKQPLLHRPEYTFNSGAAVLLFRGKEISRLKLSKILISLS
jgi:hypothetical protein